MINLVTGDGQAVSEVALPHRDLAGIHFTGSTATFQHLWRTVGENIAGYRAYPRLVGETGGKDFVIAHPSADPAVLATALVRGAYEYQGQKCSAASRGYVPRSLWQGMRDDFLAQVESLTMGDVGSDLSLFMGAVIDERAFAKHSRALEAARGRPSVRVLTGGQTDDSEGYFVQPTVLECSDPADEVFTTEYFGPILAIHVYDDARYDEHGRPGRRRRTLRADRLDHRPGPGGDRGGHGRAAVLGGQLLHQRQADRGGRRAAAVRRGAGQRHQRQGRVDLQLDPLGERPRHQGTVRPAGGLPLPAHGLIRSGPRCYRTTSYPVMWKNEPPSLAFGTPGRIWMVCLPQVSQRQANRTESGRLRPELDLSCQMPVWS